MKLNGNQIVSNLQLSNEYLNQKTKKVSNLTAEGLSFQDILQQKTGQTAQSQSTGEVKFSKHAANRLSDRNIALTDNQVERLNEGMKKAEAKGIQESLVLVDQLAFIVNVPNSTVVTAMDQTETDENVFTNIDGAVII
ncbi:MAG: flagellar protein [Lachnospiraceae bacterium]|nr:flagellar protein [Lachnospiraceae bacterium]